MTIGGILFMLVLVLLSGVAIGALAAMAVADARKYRRAKAAVNFISEDRPNPGNEKGAICEDCGATLSCGSCGPLADQITRLGQENLALRSGREADGGARRGGNG